MLDPGRMIFALQQNIGRAIVGKEEAIEYAKVIEDNIDRLMAVKDSKEEIMTPCGEQCSEPYACWYYGYCHSLESEEK